MAGPINHNPACAVVRCGEMRPLGEGREVSMTEIERKALALLNEVARERGSTHDSELLDRGFVEGEALCRAIEQHEAFRHEVSDAIVQFCGGPNYVPSEPLASFIIPKPDPLVEVLDECGFGVSSNAADDIRAAIEKRGGKIVWGEG